MENKEKTGEKQENKWKNQKNLVETSNIYDKNIEKPSENLENE